jgi:peptide deformylase
MYENLQIIIWPDPRLKKVSKPVEVFDAGLKELAARMFELMREHKGVGLAAPQVGQNIRLFVANHTGEPGNDRIYINPELTEAEDNQEDEEGCLSLPGIRVNVVRSKKLRLRAQDVEGKPIEEFGEAFQARVWQHEFDHLNGTMLTDRMGPAQKLLNRKKLKELEEKFAATKGKR